MNRIKLLSISSFIVFIDQATKIFVLNHIKLADKLGYIPVVDMENFPTIYNETQPINKSKNAWNYYFKNRKNYNLKKIYNENNFILTSNRFSKSFSHNIDNKISYAICCTSAQHSNNTH